jgi:predicted DNA-binding protein (MmcQ/YjbR family)
MAAPDPVARLRDICLALPEAAEKETWSAPTFRVRDKIFAMIHHDQPLAVWCKAPPGAQEMLVDDDPKRFFVPPYVGHNGWIGIYLDRRTDWDDVADFIEDSYRMTAPKRLIKLLEE